MLTRQWMIGKSKTAVGDVVATCRAYDNVAVFEAVDPGIMGVVDLAIRERIRGPAERACAPEFARKTRKVTLSEPWYVDGLHGPWLLLGSAHAFGAEIGLAVVHTRTGREAF